MTDQLYLHRFVFSNPADLHRFARDHIKDNDGRGLPDHPFDADYLVHALFCALFGAIAPAPFFRNRDEVLAYSNKDRSALIEQAHTYSMPQAYSCLDWERCATKPLPTKWPVGKCLGFECRVCPVVRGPAGHRRSNELEKCKDAPEVDAYLARVWRDSAAPPREAVYKEWLSRELARWASASLISAELKAFRLTRLLRRTQRSENGRRSLGVTRPDVLFRGTLRIDDGEAFPRLLERGLGRHRAFGFGMLLFRPSEAPC